MWLLQQYLCEISGLPYASLQPAAGAHGEVDRADDDHGYHKAHGEDKQRTEVLIPDSGHSTNPATAAMCGCRVVTVPSDEQEAWISRSCARV